MVENHVYIFLCSCFLRFFFFCTWSYQIWIISKQIYLNHNWNPNRYYHSRSECVWGTSNKGVVRTSQISKTGSSPLVSCYIQDKPFWEVFTSLQGIQSVYFKPCQQSGYKKRFTIRNYRTSITLYCNKSYGVEVFILYLSKNRIRNFSFVR